MKVIKIAGRPIRLQTINPGMTDGTRQVSPQLHQGSNQRLLAGAFLFGLARNLGSGVLRCIVIVFF